MAPSQSEEMYLVDPGGWLHVVPGTVFKEWCKEQLVERSDNLQRAYENRSSKGGYHFSNSDDSGGAWQPLHKLVFLEKKGFSNKNPPGAKSDGKGCINRSVGPLG